MGKEMTTLLSTDIDDFSRRDLKYNGKTKPVLTLGESGPAVIVIHEVYGFTPPVARFCRWLAASGLRVYAPILLGRPDASNRAKPSLGMVAGLFFGLAFGMGALPRGARVRVRLGEIDEIALDVHGTVLERLDAETALEAGEDEGDDEPVAGPIAIAVDVHEAEGASPDNAAS